MKRTVLFTVITSLSVGLLATSPVLADDGCEARDGMSVDAGPPPMDGEHAEGDEDGRRGRRGPPPPLSELLAERGDELDLSAESMAELSDILATEEPLLQALHEEARAARASGDQAAARAAMQEAHEAQRLLMDEIEAVLTEDELASLRTLLPPPPRMHGPGQDGEGEGQQPRRNRRG